MGLWGGGQQSSINTQPSTTDTGGRKLLQSKKYK